MKATSKFTLIALAITTLSIGGMGCRSSRYKDQVSKYGTASKAVVEKAESTYKGFADIETQRQITVAAYHPRATEQLDVNALLDFRKEWSADSDRLKHRLAVLKQLSRYGELLVALASDEPVEAVQQKTGSLVTALQGLAKESDDAGLATNLGTFSGVISKIAAVFARRKADRAIKVAVTEGEPAVAETLELIRAEMDAMHIDAVDACDDKITAYTLAFNREKQGQNPSTEKLEKMGEKLNVQIHACDDLQANSPVLAVDEFKKAHTALVEFVKSGRRPSDFGNFVQAIEDFADFAESMKIASSNDN